MKSDKSSGCWGLRTVLASTRKVSISQIWGPQPPLTLSAGIDHCRWRFLLKSPLLKVCLYLASRSSNPATTRYEVTKTHYQRHVRTGTITIQRRCKYRRVGDSSQDAQDTRADFPETLEASFSFLPKNFQNPRIAVKIQQTNSYEGSFLKKPALSISALLPPDAETFRLIKEGDLDGLIRLLTLREAFLTDRDLEGRSLLTVSIDRTVQRGPTNSCYYSMLSISDSQISVNFSLIKDQMWTFLSHIR